MIPAALSYRRAASVDDALGILAEHGEDAKLIAGGQSLLPLMKLRFADPAVLVDITPVRELAYVHTEGDELVIGAMTRYKDLHLDETLRATSPLLAHITGEIGDPQIRHRGTIGGSVAHADPAGDLPAAVLASDATLVTASPSGGRRIPASEFFLGPFTTALADDEVLTEIRMPSQAGRGWGFEKFTRRATDWAIVGVTCVGSAVGLVNMGPTALRAGATEAALAAGADVESAAAQAAEGTEPGDEPHASPDYRRHLARVLTARALKQAGWL
jgi:carbon-monoxide dehydrogenase medium subunit